MKGCFGLAVGIVFCVYVVCIGVFCVYVGILARGSGLRRGNLGVV